MTVDFRVRRHNFSYLSKIVELALKARLAHSKGVKWHSITVRIWNLNSLFRLRSYKMEQRKLNDQANTLVDFAKVNIFHDFETVGFENRELFCCTIVTH